MKALYRVGFWVIAAVVAISLDSCNREVKNLVRTSDNTAASPASVLPPPSNSIAIDIAQINPPAPFASKVLQQADHKVRLKVIHFYEANGFKSKWLTDRGPTHLYYALKQILATAPEHGLDARDYAIDRLDKAVQMQSLLYPADHRKLGELDIQLTKIFFTLTTHVADGRAVKTGFDKNVWKRPVKVVSLLDAEMLATVQSPRELIGLVKNIEPPYQQYGRLKAALVRYKSLERFDDAVFQNLQIEKRIEPGHNHAIIPAIRKKLALTDTLLANAIQLYALPDTTAYDSMLVASVARFQAMHGLEADGIIGEKTMRFLNQTFAEKAAVIALNMERLRWLPKPADGLHLVVNIPEYKLRFYNGTTKMLEMNVVVGSPEFATPVFDDALEYMVFNPTWTVPPRILKEEVIPHLQRNPLYYAEKNYTFYKDNAPIDPALESWSADINPWQYRVVQHPGPDNSLGRIKFIMPNDMNVYLHDTPSRRLFRKPYRAFSHGCIRLQEPLSLAELLLQAQGWRSEKISDLLEGEEPITVVLKNHYRVYLQYQTVKVHDDGAISFYEDIYRHDRHQLRQLMKQNKSDSRFAGL